MSKKQKMYFFLFVNLISPSDQLFARPAARAYMNWFAPSTGLTPDANYKKDQALKFGIPYHHVHPIIFETLN